MTYAPLHLHTTFSLLDGYGSIDRYVKRASELGITSMAITDHGNVHGWLDFYEATKAAGIKPILGIEAYQARKTRFDQDDEERATSKAAEERGIQHGPHHLILLAKNETGYRNIIKLSSRSFLEGLYAKPRIDHELLAEHADGVVVLSACLSGEVQQALLRDDYDAALKAAAFFQDCVGRENYFIEWMDHGIDEQQRVKEGLLRIAQHLKAPIVATNDCHYVHQSEADKHDLMLCVCTSATINQEGRFKFAGPEFYLKTYEEMQLHCRDEWLQNTLKVAEMVELDLKFGELHFPEFPLPPGEDVDTYLERDVWAGVRRRYGDPIPEVAVVRTQHELDVVKRMGFQGYFLVVADIVDWARRNGVRVGPGRGSAAGSILSYALGITGLDPLFFNLLFERFLVEGRKSMPDIDLDFDDRSRELVINYIREKYGSDRVASICTFSTEGAKMAIRDAARVMEYEYKMGDRLSKLVPPPVLGVSKTIDESLATEDMAKAYKSDPDARKIIDSAKDLEGLYRQTGVHAAGIVISKAPTTEFLPVMVTKRKEKNDDGEQIEVHQVVSQWDMNRVEQCGQLKIDCLGLRNIGVVDLCSQLIEERHDIKFDIELIPYDDKPTFDMLCTGNSTGVFQLESGGMRELMLGLQPDCIEDLMSLVSLYRPGPLGAGLHHTFVKRKRGRAPVTYDHPILEPVLKETYGTLLYQEQILETARKLAGFSAGEADDLRKAIGKKQMDKIPLFRAAFVAGCQTHNDVSPPVANKIYSDIEFFGGYGFGRAHAASYALIAYWTAYLKCHYPAEYMAALLSSVDKRKERAITYLRECNRMQIWVRPPDLANSNSAFRVLADDEILYGLQSIDGLGPSAVGPLIAARDRGDTYANLFDFLRRCPWELLDKGSIEKLIGSGSLDRFALGGESLTRSEKAVVLEVERKYLAAYVTEHPLAACWMFLEPMTSSTIDGLQDHSSGQRVTIGGVMGSVKAVRTKAGSLMYHFDVEDLTGRLEVIVFSKDAEHLNPVDGEIVLVDGRVNREGDEDHPIIKLFFEGIRRPELPEDVGGPPIRLRSKRPVSNTIVEELQRLVVRHPGDSPLYLEFPEDRHQVVLRFNSTVATEVEGKLRQVLRESF